MLCGTLYDKARNEAAQAVTQPAVPRPPRQWALDIREEYVSQFPAPAHESDDESEAEGEAEAEAEVQVNDVPVDRDEDRVGQGKAHHGHKTAARQAAPRKGQAAPRLDSSNEELDFFFTNQQMRRRPQPNEKSQPPHGKGKEVQQPVASDTSDEELKLALAESRRWSHRRPAVNLDVDRGEGPSRPYGTWPADTDDDDDDLSNVAQELSPSKLLCHACSLAQWHSNFTLH